MEVQQRFEIRFSNVSLPSPNLNPAYHKAVFYWAGQNEPFHFSRDMIEKERAQNESEKISGYQYA